MDLKTKLALAAALLLICSAGYPAASGAGTDIQTPSQTFTSHSTGRKVLIVSSDNAYPPYEFMENGTPTGFNIELIRAVAEVMDIPLEIKLGPWSLVRHKLESGQVDVLAGMYYSKEREKLADFSVPHTLVTSGLFVRKGSPIRSLEEIHGKEIIVQRDDIMHDFLESTGMTSRIVRTKDPLEALRLLSSGKCDGALLSSEIQGLYFAEKFKLTNLTVINTGLPPREYCFAVKEGNRLLVNQLNEGLNIIKATGRYKQIHDSWFGVYEENTWWQKSWKYLAGPLALISVLIAASLVWTWMLRRRVSLRTKELSQSEQRLSTLFRASPAVITITSQEDGCLLEVNEAFETISGHTREEALGRTSVELGLYADHTDRMRIIEELQRSGQVRNLEINLKTKSGRIVVGLLSTTPIELKGKTCLLTLINDITERKTAEAERDKLEAQLIQAQKMEAIGSLAGGVAHDFNNILTAILGYSELALMSQKKSEIPNEKLVLELREIQRSAQRASALTQQLLIFSRREMIKPEVLNVQDILFAMEQMLGRLITENISLNISSDSDIYPILAHHHLIEQVIMNLAVNARDAMPDGGRLDITISNVILDDAYTAEHPEASPGPHAMLTVRDTGHGMDASIMARIFEPFFTTKERGRGTGLGLSSVYGIIKQSGGHVTIYSQPGIGSTFKIYFPASTVAAASRATPAAEDEIAPGGNETVLLCEDDESVRQLSISILSAGGYHVVSAGSGMDALELAGKSGPIDLLVTDVIMPGMNGKMLAENLKKNLPNLKILFISGYTDDIIIHHGILEPGIELLMKPFTSAELLRSIRRVIDGTG